MILYHHPNFENAAIHGSWDILLTTSGYGTKKSSDRQIWCQVTATVGGLRLHRGCMQTYVCVQFMSIDAVWNKRTNTYAAPRSDRQYSACCYMSSIRTETPLGSESPMKYVRSALCSYFSNFGCVEKKMSGTCWWVVAFEYRDTYIKSK